MKHVLMLLGITLLLAGCEGMSDDNRSTVPTTNNPNLIIDSHMGSATRGFDY